MSGSGLLEGLDGRGFTVWYKDFFFSRFSNWKTSCIPTSEMCPTSLPMKTFEKFYCPCHKWRPLEITQPAYFCIFKFLFPSIIALVYLGQRCASVVALFPVECWKFHGIYLNMKYVWCLLFEGSSDEGMLHTWVLCLRTRPMVSPSMRNDWESSETK